MGLGTCVFVVLLQLYYPKLWAGLSSLRSFVFVRLKKSEKRMTRFSLSKLMSANDRTKSSKWMLKPFCSLLWGLQGLPLRVM